MVKVDLEEGFSSRDELSGDDLEIGDKFYDTPICFERIVSLIMECIFNCNSHEIEYIEVVKYLRDH